MPIEKSNEDRALLGNLNRRNTYRVLGRYRLNHFGIFMELEARGACGLDELLDGCDNQFGLVKLDPVCTGCRDDMAAGG